MKDRAKFKSRFLCRMFCTKSTKLLTYMICFVVYRCNRIKSNNFKRRRLHGTWRNKMYVNAVCKAPFTLQRGFRRSIWCWGLSPLIPDWFVMFFNPSLFAVSHCQYHHQQQQRLRWQLPLHGDGIVSCDRSQNDLVTDGMDHVSTPRSNVLCLIESSLPVHNSLLQLTAAPVGRYNTRSKHRQVSSSQTKPVFVRLKLRSDIRQSFRNCAVHTPLMSAMLIKQEFLEFKLTENLYIDTTVPTSCSAYIFQTHFAVKQFKCEPMPWLC